MLFFGKTHILCNKLLDSHRHKYIYIKKKKEISVLPMRVQFNIIGFY